MMRFLFVRCMRARHAEAVYVSVSYVLCICLACMRAHDAPYVYVRIHDVSTHDAYMTAHAALCASSLFMAVSMDVILCAAWACM